MIDSNNLNTKSCCKDDIMSTYENFPYWQTTPYYNETTLPLPVDKTAGTWPLAFFYKDFMGRFYTKKGVQVNFNLKNPRCIDYKVELAEVQAMQEYLFNNPESIYVKMAKFWGTGIPVQQWTPIALQLINSYKVTPPESARLLYSFQAALNDAFCITWHYKFLYNCPRPCQLDHDLKTILNTPRFPSYTSGHSAVSGAAQIILSHYFPKEADKLKMLAEDASISRLYGGIHFKIDLTEGLRLGRQIGAIALETMKTQKDNLGNQVDYVYNTFVDAPIMPSYYNK